MAKGSINRTAYGRYLARLGGDYLGSFRRKAEAHIAIASAKEGQPPKKRSRRPAGSGNIEVNDKTNRYRGRVRYGDNVFRTKYYGTRPEAERALKALIRHLNPKGDSSASK